MTLSIFIFVNYFENFLLAIRNTLTIRVRNIKTQVSGQDLGVTAEFKATLFNSQDEVVSLFVITSFIGVFIDSLITGCLSHRIAEVVKSYIS